MKVGQRGCPVLRHRQHTDRQTDARTNKHKEFKHDLVSFGNLLSRFDHRTVVRTYLNI